MQTIVLKKHKNSHFLTSEFHSGCNKVRIIKWMDITCYISSFEIIRWIVIGHTIYQYTLGQVAEGVNEKNYQSNLFPFNPFRIIMAVFNRLNLHLSQKKTQLDTFLNKLCSRPRHKEPILSERLSIRKCLKKNSVASIC